MKSKLIIGIPAALILVMMTYNFFNAPKQAFLNFGGFWQASGDGPFTGCVEIRQPGAGVNLSGFFLDGVAGDTPDFAGKAAGKGMVIGLGGGGETTLTLGADQALTGNGWRLAKAGDQCAASGN